MPERARLPRQRETSVNKASLKLSTRREGNTKNKEDLIYCTKEQGNGKMARDEMRSTVRLEHSKINTTNITIIHALDRIYLCPEIPRLAIDTCYEALPPLNNVITTAESSSML